MSFFPDSPICHLLAYTPNPYPPLWDDVIHEQTNENAIEVCNASCNLGLFISSGVNLDACELAGAKTTTSGLSPPSYPLLG